ncbi:MAG: 6-phosphofructokinase [Armatimonadota bacterium]|jgi:6-phosphofructokinase 1
MADPVKGNGIVAQSGGPTAVINCSLAGVIEESHKQGAIERLLGSKNGILGVLNDDLCDLTQEAPETVEGLKRTPAAALGTTRYKLQDADYGRILDCFKRHDVRYFFFNGGNDSMETCHAVAGLAEGEGYELRCIGVPKTVDNDLAVTDHCPGYGSVARAITIMTMDAGKDNEASYSTDTVKVMETMGRNTGWIAASTGLAHETEEDAPHLVYLPERPFILQSFFDDVQGCLDSLGRATIVVSEGLVDENGEYITAQTAADSGFHEDAFGHKQLSGVGDTVCALLESQLNVKARFNKPGTSQRNCIMMQSKSDAEEAYMAGAAAVQAAVAGETDKMVTLVRESNDPYTCVTGLCPCEQVAAAEKKMPDEYINEAGNGVTEAFLDYVRPLVGELPEYVRLKGVPA